ncbi:MAG: FecR domain-containing protein [Saprospiraceae bacterium]|nr:FecR domain-containing protein [Saprospiraceae bacterium]
MGKMNERQRILNETQALLKHTEEETELGPITERELESVAGFLHTLDQSEPALDFSVEEGLADLEGRLKEAASTSSIVQLRRSAIWKAAAVAALLLGSFAIWKTTQRPTVQIYAAENQQGELPDGSLYHMDDGASLAFSPRFSKRQVHLKGTAYFEVEKGSAFEVITTEGSVKVLGTAFLVGTNPGLTVTCYEGSVMVKSPSQGARVIGPGQELTLADAGMKEGTTLLEQPSWLEDDFVIRSKPLEDVVGLLSAHFSTEINLMDDHDRLFTGHLSSKDLSEALKRIAESLDLRCIQVSQHVIRIEK